MQMDRIIACLIVMSVMLATIGCSENERLVAMSEKYADQQAEQSQRVLELQRELQANQAEVGRQRDSLEEERRELAERRYMAPILAAVIKYCGLLIACILPLVLCWYLLRSQVEPIDDATVAEVLLDNFSTDRPLLLTETKNKKPIP